jgi:hypothetical protein
VTSQTEMWSWLSPVNGPRSRSWQRSRSRRPALIELLNINHQMVPGVVQPDLTAPGGEPLRAADNHVEGLLARTVGRANKRTCDK